MAPTGPRRWRPETLLSSDLQRLPRLTQAQAPLTESIAVVNEFGETRALDIPAERALTV